MGYVLCNACEGESVFIKVIADATASDKSHSHPSSRQHAIGFGGKQGSGYPFS